MRLRVWLIREVLPNLSELVLGQQQSRRAGGVRYLFCSEFNKHN